MKTFADNPTSETQVILSNSKHGLTRSLTLTSIVWNLRNPTNGWKKALIVPPTPPVDSVGDVGSVDNQNETIP